MAKPVKSHQAAAVDLTFERGLPEATDAEAIILGAILLDGSKIEAALESIQPEALSLEKHRRVLGRMRDLHDRGEAVTAVTLAHELIRAGQLESVDGLGFLAELTANLPQVVDLTPYINLVQEKARLRALIFRSQRTINAALSESGTAEEIGSQAIEDLTQAIQVSDAQNHGRTPEQIVEQFPGGAIAFIDPSARKRGLSTGYYRLDDMLGGGLQDGELIIIAARPGAGKSACLMSMAQNIVMRKRDPKPVDIFSLEMSASALLARMLCGVSKVSNSKFRAGFVNAEERDQLRRALASIMEAPLRIHDEFRRTLPGLLKAIRGAHKRGCRLIGIDFAQLLVSGSKSESRNLELEQIVRELKLCALDLEIPIVLLSQIGRSAEKRAGGAMRATLSDLKDSGSLEQSADTVMTIFREELYKGKDREDLKGVAELEILKQRNGETGIVKLRFIGNLIRFENPLDEPQTEPAEAPLWD